MKLQNTMADGYLRSRRRGPSAGNSGPRFGRNRLNCASTSMSDERGATARLPMAATCAANCGKQGVALRFIGRYIYRPIDGYASLFS